MWYIFKEGECIGTCNSEPNHEDLQERGEVTVESALALDLSEVELDSNGKPVKKPPYVPTAEEIQKNLTNAVQSHMDTAAKTRGYDNLIAAVTYADEPAAPAFQSEGQAFRAWRSLVWAYCYTALAAVVAGERQIPTAAELIAELPILSLPAQ
jgi:hypothetical protein